MRQGSDEGSGVREDGRFPPYVHLGSALDAGRDEQLAQIFRNMRLVMRVSRETIARRLATTPSTIESFEQGAVASLPHWKETCRIVRGYGVLARIDPEPVLGRIREQLQALAWQARSARAATPVEFTTGRPAARTQPAVPRSARTEVRASGRRRRARVLFALSAPLALAAALVYLAQAAPQPVYRVVGLLPDVAQRAVRAGLDYVVVLSAPRRDGLRWIDVSDPRVRKADKLQVGAR
jgi:hypothetical protein